MANLLGQLLVELGINTAFFKEGLDKATYQAKAFAKEVGDQFAEVGRGVAGLAQSFAGFDPAIGGAIQGIAGALGNIVEVGGGAAAVGTGLLAAFGAAGAAALGLAISASQSAAEIGHLSKATGVSVEALSVLGQIAGTVGIGTEQMGKALERMDRSALAAAQSGPKVSNAYTQLGVAVTDTSGKMRSAEEIFNDISKAFSTLPDGPQKTAYAMQIFGRAGAQMIPLLDEGGAKLATLEGHFKSLGATIDAATAESSEELKSNMSLMQAAFTGIENELVKDLVPALNIVAQEFITFFEENHDSVIGWAEAFADAGKIVLNVFQGLVGAVKIVRDAFQLLIEELQAVFGALGSASYDVMKGNFKAAWQDVKAGAADAANSAKYNFNQAVNDIKGSISGINDVWKATLDKPVEGPKRVEGPAAKAVDTTWIDKIVQASERAAAKQQELAEAMGKVSQTSIEAAATAEAAEQIQKIWDEAVDKGITTNAKFLASWRAAVPAIQEATEWEQTFKAAVSDQKELDTFNDKIDQQIVSLRGIAEAQSQVDAAMAKNDATLTPLVNHLSQLQKQYDTLKDQYGENDTRVVALNGDLQRQAAEVDNMRAKVGELNAALKDKAANDFAQELKKLNDEASAATPLQRQIAAAVDDARKKFGDAAVDAQKLADALTAIKARALASSAEQNAGIDPDKMKELSAAIEQLQKDWQAAAGTAGAGSYAKALNELKAQQADLAAQSGGFVSGLKAGFANFATTIQSQGQIMEKLTTTALNGIADNFAAMVTTGKAKWQDLVNSMEQALLASELKNLLNGLFSGLQSAFSGGGFGGGFMQAFGGPKERGGDVTPGKWYVVGEKRPEIFVPGTSGTILPSASPSAMTGGDTRVNMYVQTPDAHSFGKSAGQLVRDMTNQVSLTTARNRGAY